MNTAALVDRGLALRAEIAEREAELKGIEERLKAAALQGEQIELVDAEREGRQWLAAGSAAVVPVVLTSDLLMQSFADGSPAHAKVEAAAQGRLAEFYRPVTTWKMLATNGKAFRREAAGLLGPQAGAELVAACVLRDKYGVPRSQVKVEWDRAVQAEEVQA